MKMFVLLECFYFKNPIEVNNKIYSATEHILLDGTKTKVTKYSIDQAKDFVYHLVFKQDYLYGQVWVREKDLCFFEKEIMSEQLIPIDIRFTPEDCDDESIMFFSQNDLKSLYEKCGIKNDFIY